MDALEGIRVLDVTTSCGSYCTKLLADLGADVLKIEPPTGSEGRRHGPFFHDEPDPERSLWWFFFNTNKRGLTLDLDTQTGGDLFRRLVETAAVVVEDATPGVMRGRGLAYQDLQVLNPRLVYASVTPYGQEGPYAHFQATDLTAQAMGNVMYRIGHPGDPPNSMGAEQAYNQVGAQAAFATLVAVLDAQRSQQGQHVDVSMHEAVSIVDWNAVPRFSLEGRIVGRGARGDEERRPGVSSRRIWYCKEGKVRFQLIQVLGPQKEWAILVQWLAAHGFAADLQAERWSEMETRLRQVQHIEDCVEAFFQASSAVDLMEEGQARGLAVMAFGHIRDLLSDPQLLSESFFTTLEHEGLEATLTYPGGPYRLSETPWRLKRRAPHHGEHNLEVYEGELGLTRGDLLRLKQSGHI